MIELDALARAIAQGNESDCKDRGSSTVSISNSYGVKKITKQSKQIQNSSQTYKTNTKKSNKYKQVKQRRAHSEKPHEMALEWVSGADFVCMLQHFSHSTDWSFFALLEARVLDLDQSVNTVVCM